MSALQHLHVTHELMRVPALILRKKTLKHKICGEKYQLFTFCFGFGITCVHIFIQILCLRLILCNNA